MKNILRIIIALIFIASGFVKVVDVVGFSFKLEEYFAPDVFNMPFLEQQALPVAIFVVALELVLGMMLLLKIRLKSTLKLLIALCIFFAFLTFYSAYFNKVTDCGCFGDAIKFTPWQSFFKDLFLLFGLIFLWLQYKSETNGSQKTNSKNIALGIFSLLMVFIVSHGILHEPLIDFRDYKTGTDLKMEKQKISANPAQYITFYSLKNQKTGEVLQVDQDQYIADKKYWEEGSPWKIEEGQNESRLIKKGYQSEVMKFNIEDNSGNNVTENVLSAPKAILLFSYAPEKADSQIIKKTEEKLHTIKNAEIYGVSTHPNTFKTIKNFMMDGTAIKTIARSNPFVLILQNGKIVDKKSAKDFLNDN